MTCLTANSSVGLKKRNIQGAVLSIFASLFFLGGLVGVWGPGVTTGSHLVSNLVASYFLAWGIIWSFSKLSRRELIGRFVLITGSACVAIGSLEALSFSGLVDYRRIIPKSNTPSWFLPHNEFDPELLNVRKPYARISGMEKPNLAATFCSPVEPYYYDVRYDRNGFHNAAEIYRADIAIVGDSFIEGVEISGDDTLNISSFLQRYMNASVVNLGSSGYGPQQELAVLKRYAVPVRPKVIVWAFYTNDLGDLLGYEEAIAQLKLDGPNGSAVDRSFLRNSLYAIWWSWFKCKPDSDASLIAGDYDERSGDTVQVLFGDWRHLTKRDLTALNKLRDIFAEAYRVSTQHKAKLVVAFLPEKIRVYKDVIRTPEKSKLPAEVDDLPQRMQNMLADISPHIGFVDLTPAFTEEVSRGNSLFLKNDTHWTELGHQVAAQTIHEYLQRELSSGAEVSQAHVRQQEFYRNPLVTSVLATIHTEPVQFIDLLNAVALYPIPLQGNSVTRSVHLMDTERLKRLN